MLKNDGTTSILIKLITHYNDKRANIELTQKIFYLDLQSMKDSFIHVSDVSRSALDTLNSGIWHEQHNEWDWGIVFATVAYGHLELQHHMEMRAQKDRHELRQRSWLLLLHHQA